MKGLTGSQERVLEFIMGFARENGFPPSVREIGKGLNNIKSSTVAYYIKVLQKKGFITRGSKRARDLRLGDKEKTYGVSGLGNAGHPLLGSVPAGSPTAAIEEVEDVFWLDQRLSRSKDSYLLRVKGDSMKDAAILEGDLLVVRPQPSAESGEIVVAITPEGEGTVKRYKLKEGVSWLFPENENYGPILEPFRIVGKVVGVIRKV